MDDGGAVDGVSGAGEDEMAASFGDIRGTCVFGVVELFFVLESNLLP